MLHACYNQVVMCNVVILCLCSLRRSSECRNATNYAIENSQGCHRHRHCSASMKSAISWKCTLRLPWWLELLKEIPHTFYPEIPWDKTIGWKWWKNMENWMEKKMEMDRTSRFYGIMAPLWANCAVIGPNSRNSCCGEQGLAPPSVDICRYL